MKTEYYGHSKEGGIYKIINLKNRKVYIGSAKGFKQRRQKHVQSLKKGTHHNKHLQASWNKHGEDVFLFEVIEVVEGNKLVRTTREQEFLDELILNDKWENCYNFQQKTVQRDGTISNPEVHKRKQSLLKKAFYKTSAGKAALEKIADSRRGKTYEEFYGSVEKAEEIKEKIRANKLVEMNKPKVKENLRKQLKGKSFKERFGEKKTELILNKMSKSRKGKYTSKNSSRYKVYDNIVLLSPEGKIYTKIEGVKDFASKNGLPANHLCELLKGKRKSCKGWIIKL